MTRLCLAIVALTSISVSAQWLNQPTPGLPRTSTGRPDLAAPTPIAPSGKPDLSGVWRLGTAMGYAANLTTDLTPGEIQPWASALSRQRQENFGKDDPEVTGCLPGGPRHITRAGLVRIIQTPMLLAILYEDLAYRQIFLDGRDLPHDPNPSWMGYSIGHWEGDTLVVESAGFNDRTWLDFSGHPHTEALRMTERFRRPDFGHLAVDVTLDDRMAYAKPWTVSAGGSLAADTDLLEYVCAENEKDRSHLVGRTSEEKKVTVAPSVLATYAGVYEVPAPTAAVTRGTRTVFTITLAGDELQIDFGGKGKVPMIPLSQTMFSPRLLGTYEFVTNDRGVVTHMLVHSAEEVLMAVRQQ